MLDKYKDSQKVFYDYFMHSNSVGHISHAYMIESNGVSYAFNLALDLAKFFLCNGVYDEKICNLIDKDKKYVENTMFRINKKYKEMF